SGLRDQLAELAAATGLSAAFLPAVTRGGGSYGLAVLSRYPIVRRVRGLYSAGREPRGYLAVEVEMEEGVRVGFAVTHLSPDPAERAAQIEELLAFLREFPGPLVLAGDFNLRPEDGDFQSLTAVLRDALAAFEAGGRATFFPAPGADGARIDFIFVSAEFRPEGGRVAEIDYSDHRPALAHLSFAREDSEAMGAG
ncbi:MAG: endonuclease/exonuclease/phosphatase family protein, partial [Firmicutes bacterium]|nr:endonuclease/exonuclease/phosphatase family protein [Bacillota bacterium]